MKNAALGVWVVSKNSQPAPEVTPSVAEVLRGRLRSLAKAVGVCRAAFAISPAAREDRTMPAAEAVHGLRVACRRGGVALRLAGHTLEPESAAALRRAVRRLRRAAGAVRDCDVQHRLLGHLGTGAGGERARAAEFALRMIDQDRIVAERGLIDVLTRVVPRELRRALPDARDATPLTLGPAGALAGRVIAASGLISSSPDAFHEVRILVKNLRYTLELLGPALERDKATAIRERLLPTLANAQEHMGSANDVTALVERLDRYALMLRTAHHTELLSSDARLQADVRALHDRFAMVRDARIAKATKWWQETGLPELVRALADAGVAPTFPATDGREGRAPVATVIDAKPRGGRDMELENERSTEETPMMTTTPRLQNGAHAPTPTLHPEAARQRDLWLSGHKMGVIDIGSNSIRLLAVELVDSQTWTVLAEERAMTRLAQGLAGSGELSSEAMARSVEAIGRFKLQAERLGVQQVRAFATAAVREATNKRDFVSLVHDRTGLMMELVSARDEGRLTHLSVSRVFDLSKGLAGVIDIGGGSLEVVQSRDGIITANTSMPLGAVRLTEAFGGANAAAGKNFDHLKREVERRIKARVAKPEHAPSILVGCGGTFTTLLTLAAATRGVLIERNSPALTTLGPVTRDQLKGLLKELRGRTLEQRLRVPGLPSDRADIVVAGLVVVERLMKRLGAAQLHVHPGGFREGLLMRLIEDEAMKRQPSVAAADALASVRRLAEACHYDKPHSEHVAGLALSLYEQFRQQSDLIPHLGADGAERTLLEAAAVLHDVGTMVAYEQHHKHSFTIIRHATLAGLSSRQAELVAQIARYHRKAGPKQSHRPFAALSDKDQALVTRLAAILRVADGLDRAHAQRTTSVHVRFGNGVVRIEPECAAASPEDLKAADEKADLLREVTGSKIDVQPLASA